MVNINLIYFEILSKYIKYIISHNDLVDGRTGNEFHLNYKYIIKQYIRHLLTQTYAYSQ